MSLCGPSGASSPRIVADANGNAAAVWLENTVVKAATKSFNGNWSNATSLSDTTAASPDLAVDSAGDVIAVGREKDVEASTKIFGSNWSARLKIDSTGAALPKIAIGGTGSSRNAVIVWQGLSGTTNVVYSSFKKGISEPWSAQQIVSDPNTNAINADVAVDVNNNAIAIWYAYDFDDNNYSNVVVQSAAMTDGTKIWSAPVNLSKPGIRNPATLIARVAVDSLGKRDCPLEYFF